MASRSGMLAVVRGVAVGLGLVLASSATPSGLAAQQTASVLVRVSVIKIPVTPAAFDSLSHALRDSVSAGTRARAMAHARERGLRVAMAPESGRTARSAAAAGKPDVLLVEYVAN